MTRRGTVTLLAALAAALAALAGGASPPAHGAEQFLETLIVPGDGTRVQTGTVLRQGERYGFSISNVVTLTYNTGRQEDVDAVYCFDHRGGKPIPTDTCAETPPGPASVVPLFLDVGGGPDTSPGGLADRVFPYRDDHIYESTFVAPATGKLGARRRPFGAAPPATGTGGYAIVLYDPDPAAPAPGPAPPPTPAAAVPPGSLPGQPPIIGPPLFRIVDIHPAARAGSRFYAAAQPRSGPQLKPQVGWVLGAGDAIAVEGGLYGQAPIRLQALPGGATFEVHGSGVYGNRGLDETAGYFVAGEAPTLRQGEAVVSTGGARAQALGTAIAGAALLTPVGRVDVAGSARVRHDPRRRVTTVGNVRGSVSVTPTNARLRGLRLAPGQQVEVTPSAIGRPFALVPDLQTTIPSPRAVRAGPAIVTAPSRLSLRSLARSKCVAVAVTSARPARVLVTIFSGRRSVRLFGQRLVVFTAASRKSTCIPVPARARTFNVRTPLSFAVGYALGARGRPGERATRPVIRPITLIP